MGNSTAPTVPDSKRIVVIEELGGVREHLGWFDAASAWWFALSDERLHGDKMPSGEWCSLSIGNITGWREIIQHNAKSAGTDASEKTL
jgi:hypothetical protein